MGMRLKLWALFSHIKTFKTFLPHAANCSHLVTSESKMQLPRHFGQQSKRCPAASSKVLSVGSGNPRLINPTAYLNTAAFSLLQYGERYPSYFIFQFYFCDCF